jgi:hypothetical protein
MAQAAPGQSPQSEIIDLQCENLGAIQVAVSSTSDHANENAPAWGVGHIVGGNMVLIPFSFDFEGTFTPTGGDPQPISFSSVKGNGGPANGTYDTCTFEESDSDASGTFEATGTVVALIQGGSK